MPQDVKEEDASSQNFDSINLLKNVLQVISYELV